MRLEAKHITEATLKYLIITSPRIFILCGHVLNYRGYQFVIDDFIADDSLHIFGPKNKWETIYGIKDNHLLRLREKLDRFIDQHPVPQEENLPYHDKPGTVCHLQKTPQKPST